MIEQTRLKKIIYAFVKLVVFFFLLLTIFDYVITSLILVMHQHELK